MKPFSNRAIFLAFFVSIGCPLFSQVDFYMDKGDGHLTLVNGYADEINATVWLYRLYKAGEPTQGNNFWGVVIGSTLENAKKRLESSQDFELRYNAFMGKGRTQDKTYTHFNPLGPIARMDDNNYDSDKQKAGTTYQHIYETAKDYFNTYQDIDKQVKQILNGKPINPFDNFGKTFKEYTSNLKDALGQVFKLKNLLSSGRSLDQLMLQTQQEMDQKWAILKQNKNQMLDAIANYSPSNNTEKHTGGNYVVFTYMNNVPTATMHKNVYYISSPIWYNGNRMEFERNFKSKILPQFVQKIPDYLLVMSPGFVFYDNDTRDLIKTQEQCERVIQNLKRSIINGGHTSSDEDPEILAN
jgi:hypothetical protein